MTAAEPSGLTARLRPTQKLPKVPLCLHIDRWSSVGLIRNCDLSLCYQSGWQMEKSLTKLCVLSPLTQTPPAQEYLPTAAFLKQVFYLPSHVTTATAGGFERQLEKGIFRAVGDVPCAGLRDVAPECTLPPLQAPPNQFPSSMDQVSWGQLMVVTCSSQTRFISHSFHTDPEASPPPPGWYPLSDSALLLLMAGGAKSWIISALTSQRKKSCIPKENKGFLNSHHKRVLLSAFCPIKNEEEPCLLSQVQVLTPQVNNRHLPNVRLINCFVLSFVALSAVMGKKKTPFFFVV